MTHGSQTGMGRKIFIGLLKFKVYGHGVHLPFDINLQDIISYWGGDGQMHPAGEE
ncbi:MAG: hypothetical protein K9L56_10615 [Clostridiales bacterium]|nr:hypothetical protein [Clostridiales bacterium]